MVKGLYLPADPSESIEERNFNSLADYQAAVGGWVEGVDIPALGATIYVNDEGIMRHLPFNARASFLWWFHVPEARGAAMLVGNAVLVGMPDKDGETTDVPAQVVERLLGPRLYAVALHAGVDSAWIKGERGGLLNHIVMPLAHGDPTWLVSDARFDDYTDAIAWAMLIAERGAVGTVGITIVDDSNKDSRISLRVVE